MGVPKALAHCTLAQESDTLLVWPSIRTAIRPAVRGLVGMTTVPILLLRVAAAVVRPVIRTRVPGEYNAVNSLRASRASW